MRGCWLLAALFGAAATAETFLVAAGVEKYDDPRIAPLMFAVADAKAVAATFRAAGVPSRNVVVLTSDQPDPARRPSRIALLSAFESVRDRARAGDRLVFFFAGHGVEEADGQYLLTVDCRRSLLRDTALPTRLIDGALEGLQAAEVLFLIDACRNDPMSGRGDADARLTDGLARGLRPMAVAPPTAGPPRAEAVLLACDVGERAWEDPERGHGAFTAFLIQGLGGAARAADGQVHLAELARYVRDSVSEWARRQGRQQTPRLTGPAELDMVLLTPPDEPLISISFANLPLAEALVQLSEQFGVQVALEPGVDGTLPVTGRLENQPFSAALKVLLTAYGLSVRRDGPVYVITPGQVPPAAPAAREALTDFPIGLWLYVPSGPATDAELERFWEQVLADVPGLGFDTVVNTGTDRASEVLMSLCERLGLAVVPRPTGLRDYLSGGPGPGHEDPAKLVSEAAAVLNRHPNVLAWIAVDDPMPPAWLDRWRQIGPAMAQALPHLPGGLACYDNAAALLQFHAVTPVPIYQSFVYRQNLPVAEQVIPSRWPDLARVRPAAPDHRCWPWVQAFEGMNCGARPSLAVVRASCLVGLAAGARGYFFGIWCKPLEWVNGLCDSEFRALPYARELGLFLPRLKYLGSMLAPYGFVEGGATVAGPVAAGLYQGPDGRRLLMLASTDVVATVTATVSLTPGLAAPTTRLRDVESGELLAGRRQGGAHAFEVPLAAADGRLFEVLR